MEIIKKSRGCFPDTKQGQKEYEKQWRNNKQFGPTIVRTDYSRFTRPDELPKSFNTK